MALVPSAWSNTASEIYITHCLVSFMSDSDSCFLITLVTAAYCPWLCTPLYSLQSVCEIWHLHNLVRGILVKSHTLLRPLFLMEKQLKPGDLPRTNLLSTEIPIQPRRLAPVQASLSQAERLLVQWLGMQAVAFGQTRLNLASTPP